jgi:hypothetical protein
MVRDTKAAAILCWDPSLTISNQALLHSAEYISCAVAFYSLHVRTSPGDVIRAPWMGRVAYTSPLLYLRTLPNPPHSRPVLSALR